MNCAAIFEYLLLQQNVAVNPISHEARCPPIEPNHYAVIGLNPAGEEIYGWDFKMLAVATAFADSVRQKHLSLEIWAQDRFGRALGRRVAGIDQGQWTEASDTKANSAAHESNTETTARDQVRMTRPLTHPVERRLLQGDAAREILGVAKDMKCDLIVLGTHGRTGLGRLLMGSVAEQVVRHASCPVLTVKMPLLRPPSSEESSARANEKVAATPN